MQSRSAHSDSRAISRELRDQVSQRYGVGRAEADLAEIEVTAEALRRVKRLRTSKDIEPVSDERR